MPQTVSHFKGETLSLILRTTQEPKGSNISRLCQCKRMESLFSGRKNSAEGETHRVSSLAGHSLTKYGGFRASLWVMMTRLSARQ
jgi:hypothetical protein